MGINLIAPLRSVRISSTPLTVGDDVGGHQLANTDHAKVMLDISGQPIEVYFDVLTDSAVRWPITLGAGASRDMDFLMDFKHQHMCLLLHPDLH